VYDSPSVHTCSFYNHWRARETAAKCCRKRP
jgi:hypothetical protein